MNFKKSSGAAFLIMFIIILMGAISLFLTKANNSVSLDRSVKTTQALKQAKLALIDYAATYYYKSNFKRFGFLPCPNLSGSTEGTESGNCGTQDVNTLGKLPWKTLGMKPPLDDTGECIWYAASGFYKNGTSPSPPDTTPRQRTEMLNEDTNGLFTIYKPDGSLDKGTNSQDRVVAVLIAPGAPLAGQSRTAKGATDQCSPDYNAANFLDNFNGINNRAVSSSSATIDDFIRGDNTTKNDLNDRIMTVTRKEIFNRIVKSKKFKKQLTRTTEALSLCLVAYGNLGGDRSLPMPAPLNINDYKDDINYDDVSTATNLKFGRYPFIVNSSGKSAFISDTGLDTNTNDDIFDVCNNLTLGDGSVVDLSDETKEERLFWKHWKDHFYYAVGNKFRADGAAANYRCNGPNACLTVNGVANGRKIAVVFYAGSRIKSLAQIRNGDVPAADTDTKQTISNYLEGRNDDNPADTTGTLDYEYGDTTNTFNDVLYCINGATAFNPPTVTECPK